MPRSGAAPLNDPSGVVQRVGTVNHADQTRRDAVRGLVSDKTIWACVTIPSCISVFTTGVPSRAAGSAPTGARQQTPLPPPAAAQEALAQRIYNTLNAKVTDAAQRISLVSARRCADTYSLSLIARALRLLERRSSIAGPVGFFVTFLCSEQKAARMMGQGAA